MLKKLSKMMARALATPVATSGCKHRPRLFAPQVEALQERLAPAVLIDGNLYIYGTPGPDVVSTGYASGRLRVTENGVNWYFSLNSITGGQLFFFGDDGDDFFDARNSNGLRTTASGGKGNDALLSDSNYDFLFGGDGD